VPEFTFEEWDAALRFGLRDIVQVEVLSPRVFRSEEVYVLEDSGLNHLLLPGDRHGAGAELQIEGVILGVKAHSFHGRKLYWDENNKSLGLFAFFVRFLDPIPFPVQVSIFINVL